MSGIETCAVPHSRTSLRLGEGGQDRFEFNRSHDGRHHLAYYLSRYACWRRVSRGNQVGRKSDRLPSASRLRHGCINPACRIPWHLCQPRYLACRAIASSVRRAALCMSSVKVPFPRGRRVIVIGVVAVETVANSEAYTSSLAAWFANDWAEAACLLWSRAHESARCADHTLVLAKAPLLAPRLPRAGSMVQYQLPLRGCAHRRRGRAPLSLRTDLVI